MADKFDRLISVLEKELKLTGTEIAEILWLAMQRHSSSQTQKTPSGDKTTTVENQPTNTTTTSEISSSPKSQDSTSSTISKQTHYAEVSSKTDSTSINKSFLPIKAPDASSLRHPLNIARALRPLMQYISYGKAILLDENATVERIAELEGICIPVLKSPLELQFDLALVVDQSDSMIFWQKTTQELQQLLKHYGIFRNLQTWGMVTDQQGNIRLRQVIKQNSHSHYLYSPQKLIDPSGRRLILVVSDCVSEIWRNGKAFSALESWGKQNIVAIIQMLPERMWLRTALSLGAMVQLNSLQATVPNRNLLVKEILLWNDVDLKTGIKVPVFSLELELVETWSEMVVGKGTIGTGGFVFSASLKKQQTQLSGNVILSESSSKTVEQTSLTQEDSPSQKVAKTSLTQEEIEERVYNFKMSSSEIARNLAKLLSAAPAINLPIVRLIQKNLLSQSQPVHVGEVFLGGILKPQILINPDTNPDEVQYHFVDEQIRDILLKDSPRRDSKKIITVISQDFADRLGKTLKEFYALLKKPDELEKLKTEKNVENFDVNYFATITTKVLKRLGGAYALLAEEIEKSQPPPPPTESQSGPCTFEVATIEIIETNTFEFTVATLERQSGKAKGKQEKWVIKRQKQQAEGIIEVIGEGIELELMEIPGGTFWMGAPEGELQSQDRERPQHKVTVPSFYMGRYQVTQAQWKAIAERTDLKVNIDLDSDPSRFKEAYEQYDRWTRPVEKVNWHQAKEFCDRLSKLTEQQYRLPTEAEWEYACRSVNSKQLLVVSEVEASVLSEELTLAEWNEKYNQPFHFGETLSTELANYDGNYTYQDGVKGIYREQTTPVGYFKVANAFGLYDMHGNVWEWCADSWHESYAEKPKELKDNGSIVWLDGNITNYVIRGGSWFINPFNCRSANRYDIPRVNNGNNVSFRVVRSSPSL